MKITQVNFRTPVSFGSAGTVDFFDVTRREFTGVTITEKGNFLLVTGLPGFKGAKRKRVPMSNVTEITEDEVPEAPVLGKELPPAPTGGPSSASAGGPATPPPALAAARGVNKPAEPAS